MVQNARRIPLKVSRDMFYADFRKAMARRCRQFEPVAAETLFGLVQTYNALESRMAGKIKLYGLTLAGLNVLGVLREHREAGCPLNRLSDLLIVTRANVTGLIDGLVRRGFVERREHKTDRRVCIARITPRGESFLDSYYPAHYSEVGRIFKILSVDEKMALSATLLKLRRFLEQMPPVVKEP
jgi:MarR family 2-MHQ and catechol resistance regulon transcriptional repressor